MKYICAAVVALVTSLAMTANALATDTPAPDKVFVCKYVGTPGVNETLQTGQNPISVSISSINGFPGVGGFFSDQQGRSLVLAFDTGQGEEGLSCPDGQGCTENCNPPPTDVCTNIEGVQESVPEGMHATEDENGRPICLPDETPTDVCPNIPGNQEEVPPGFGIVNGECVLIDITPFCAPPAVLVDGVCIVPPPPPGNPPGVNGNPDIFCDLGAQVYRVRGTINGEAVDSAAPPTIPGNTRGFTNVTLVRGDTSFRTVVFTYGDCSKQAPFTPPVVTTAVPTPTPVVPVAPKPVVKPKPVRKPTVVKKKVIKKKVVVHKVVHKCKPYKDGTKRVWVKGMGCHVVLPPEPKNLTG
jgi:hypothetical protein